DFVSGTLDAFSVDDTTYGIPLELNISSVFYNGEIFDEYGLDEPETLEELKDVVSTLNDNGVNPIALGNKDAWTGSMWYMYLARSEEHTSELQSRFDLVCRLLLEKKKKT